MSRQDADTDEQEGHQVDTQYRLQSDIDKDAEITIVGESVMSESLAYAITKEKNKTVIVISELQTDEKLLLEGDKIATYVDDIEKCLKT